MAWYRWLDHVSLKSFFRSPCVFLAHFCLFQFLTSVSQYKVSLNSSYFVRGSHATHTIVSKKSAKALIEYFVLVKQFSWFATFSYFSMKRLSLFSFFLRKKEKKQSSLINIANFERLCLSSFDKQTGGGRKFERPIFWYLKIANLKSYERFSYSIFLFTKLFFHFFF